MRATDREMDTTPVTAHWFSFNVERSSLDPIPRRRPVHHYVLHGEWRTYYKDGCFNLNREMIYSGYNKMAAREAERAYLEQYPVVDGKRERRVTAEVSTLH
jgi:hypothetical protein